MREQLMPKRNLPAPTTEPSLPERDRPSRKHFGDRSPLEETTLLAYLPTLYARRWTALPIFVVAVLMGAAYTFTATPIYEAQGRLLIEVENPNVLTFKQVIEQDRDTPDFYQTQYELMKSRRLARKTLDALGLWNDSSFTGRDEDRGRFSLKRFVEAVGGAGKPLQAPATKPAPSAQESALTETAAQQSVIDTFLTR